MISLDWFEIRYESATSVPAADLSDNIKTRDRQRDSHSHPYRTHRNKLQACLHDRQLPQNYHMITPRSTAFALLLVQRRWGLWLHVDWVISYSLPSCCIQKYQAGTDTHLRACCSWRLGLLSSDLHNRPLSTFLLHADISGCGGHPPWGLLQPASWHSSRRLCHGPSLWLSVCVRPKFSTRGSNQTSQELQPASVIAKQYKTGSALRKIERQSLRRHLPSEQCRNGQIRNTQEVEELHTSTHVVDH